MKSGKNIKQKKNKRNRETFSVVKRIYSRAQYLGKERELRKHKGRMNMEVRRQEKLDIVEEKDFRRRKLPGKYTVKMLYRWNNGKFEEKYLRKLERNWQK